MHAVLLHDAVIRYVTLSVTLCCAHLVAKGVVVKVMDVSHVDGVLKDAPAEEQPNLSQAHT